MSDNQTCSPNESPACCCVDIGTMLDGSDTTTEIVSVFESRDAAEAQLAKLTELANSKASEPVKIESDINEKEGQFQLAAKFEFCCQAESLIFQMALR